MSFVPCLAGGGRTESESRLSQEMKWSDGKRRCWHKMTTKSVHSRKAVARKRWQALQKCLLREKAQCKSVTLIRTVRKNLLSTFVARISPFDHDYFIYS